MPSYARFSIALLSALLITSAGAAQPQQVPPTVAASAGQPASPPAPTPASAPQVPDALRAQFFKAKSDLLESQQAAATLQQAVQDAIQAMRSA